MLLIASDQLVDHITRRNLLLASASPLIGAAQTAPGNSTASINSAALLGKHDVVYLTPTAHKADALPLGNGDLVGMVTMPPRGLELVINKSNLWDDRPNEPPLPANWAWDPAEEERWTTIVSGAQLAFRSSAPILDQLYLDDFEARLNLHKAQVEVRSASPLGTLQASTFVSTDPAVLVVDYDEASPDPIARDIDLERWGSRRLFHWYSQYDPKQTATGLDGTRAGADDRHVWIEQKLRSVSFAIVARFTGAPFRTEVRNRHAASIRTAASQRLKGQLYLSVVTSEDDPSPLQAAVRNVDRAVSMGRDALVDAHGKRWADFWNRSYIRIPHDYFENLYYFSLYQLAASSQGKYPPTHCGGLWFWNRDIRRWGHYYHWNVQQQYWPVHASNHAELARPYYEFRYSTLPQTENYARKVHNRGGAFYSDVTDRQGRGTIHQHVSNILTAGPQIAMDFWRHYLYTQDREFLRARAYPVMKATAQFYLETVERGDDGKYHVPRSTGFENFIEQRDTISDLATIRQAFAACIRASEILETDPELRVRWAGVLQNLAEFTVMHNAADENGKPLPPVFSSGLPLMDAQIGPDPHHHWTKKRSVRKGERQFNISFYVENAPVFPSGVIGLGQRGTELFQVAINTFRSLGDGPAWNSLPVISAARLGCGDDCLRLMSDMVRRYQLAPQGYFAELTEAHEFSGNRHDMSRPFPLYDGRRAKERAMLPGVWFDFPDLEIGGVLMTALNEMLLQSHDGVIRVFPALPGEWRDVAFHLRAGGAFLVTGEVRNGEIQPYLIESLTGAECRTETPWPNHELAVRDVTAGKLLNVRGARVAFPARAGSRYLIFRVGGAEDSPRPPDIARVPNQAPKEWNGRRIGIPRQF